jgi:sulfinoalanine decarboxylase/sulfinoalanine decarboxylase/aspartate 1-decarboxylase
MQEELQIFHQFADEILKNEKKEPVVQPINPDKLFNTLDLDLKEQGVDDDTLTSLLKQVVLNTPKTTTRKFFNQLFGGRNAKATLGELLAVMLNSSMYTYKVGGVQVGIEKEIINKVCSIINYGESADGTLAPGGSMCNFMALLMARDSHDRAIKSEGVHQKMTMYTSVESHYSITKNAMFSGLGINQIRRIPTDDYGRMLADQLDEQIIKDKQAGFVPVFVNATAGTTVLGAFDPIDAIADVTSNHDIWLHVDGAYCGSVIFSDQHKHLVNGLERSDSFCFNAHKMLNTPLSCSILVTQKKHNLKHSFACEANYLYQTDEDDYNLGKTSLQCGRRNDALKFWVLWKSVGTKGLANIVDRQFTLAETARKYISNHSDYTLYSFDNSISVCFNYKDVDPKIICNQLYKQGKLMIGYGSYEGTEFIRLITINSNNTDQEILDFFKTLESFTEKELLALNA